MLRLKLNFLLWALLVLPGVVYSVESTVDPKYIALGEKGIKANANGNLFEAMHLLKESADKGYAPAQATLAYIMDKADEDEEAFKLYKQSALQSHPPGQYGLAIMYMKGEGVAANQKIAGRWMALSAKLGHVPAMLALALAYEHGTMGLERNLDAASEWILRCHEKANSVCTQRLSQAYRTGNLGLPVDLPKAQELYRLMNQGVDLK